MDVADIERRGLTYLEAGRRLAVREDEDIPGRFIGYCPRNGDGYPVSGTWVEWVDLARSILEEDSRRRTLGAEG